MPSTTPPNGEQPSQRDLSLQDGQQVDEETQKELVGLIEQLHHGQLSEEEQVRLGDLIVSAPTPEPQNQSVAMMRQVSYQGPLPPPEQLNAYDEETRRLIVNMAVDEQHHTHDMRSKGLEGAIKKDERGQRYGLTVAIVGLVAATVIAPFSSVAAGVIGTLDLVGMVAIFVAPRILEKQRKGSQPPEDDA
ncbi:MULTISPECIES: DUF2335 domain-containing protein [Chromohalobacter]|uniref:DUF2335 domain-containing protein n=2 Tax=Chromohalobacter TaxID=42054 RepID=A0ABZ0YEA8_9GAMM|nr:MULTISPECIES: DUF2335 domain-containing protein [Chromohalobacter]MCK0753361.1 DUF2335 domain-containing protein [Chromohalobacter japonicus]MCK0766467.1 DUF2335 domain-containing protein [Chromohalobacter beijerinckii]MCK0769630.1 DUF2335 domain-containing protein [Chromohalobacter canadensis]WQH10410.1 DUF2335 domain-containing protein [Chromohalobacter canadensis]